MSTMQVECQPVTNRVSVPTEDSGNRTPAKSHGTTQLQFEKANVISNPIQLDVVLQQVLDMIAPVWPLKDYVAVNPFLGLSDRPFLKARQLLRSVSDAEVLMPLGYFQAKYGRGDFEACDIRLAFCDVEAINGAVDFEVDDVVSAVAGTSTGFNSSTAGNADRCFQTIAELADTRGKSGWAEMIRDEIGRHLSAYYDEGQAVWQSPCGDLPLFVAWKSMAETSRRPELSGLGSFRQFVNSLPMTAEESISICLEKLSVPEDQWQSFLLCQAHSIPGWSSWTKYKQQQSSDDQRDDSVDLLAIRLAYDMAVSEHTGVRVNWDAAEVSRQNPELTTRLNQDDDSVLRFILLRATERAYERKLIHSLGNQNSSASPVEEKGQPLAQMVFCIDVRSERYRRNLEATSSGIQTFGFAGFFGLPVAFQSLGENSASPHLPALLSPQYTVKETIRGASLQRLENVISGRGFKRSLRKRWKQFQTSAVGCFGFVEATGIGFGWKLFSKSIGRKAVDTRFDGVSADDVKKLGPDISQLAALGISNDQQVDMAESILRGIGIIQNFAKLVVFCGHGSTVQNNPLQAGLDCGACCGHSGEPNARLAAMLLNQSDVRAGLHERGIAVPQDTRFVAAVHDTTSDGVSFFDTDLMSAEQSDSLTELDGHTTQATGHCRLERMPHLAANSVAEVLKRTADWSEVRPEWGLAGNAAFIVAPRRMTDKANLDGRSFLHSYDFRNDLEFKVLEQIMTAPMVVAHWINMQYYASSVDNQHYGSGSKTIHNVVGKFGVFSGNGGDLTTGLPWQSVHNGTELQHEPLRLLSVIAAPREAVGAIIRRHKVVSDLLVNNWLNLVVFDEGQWHRFDVGTEWQLLADES